MEPKKAVITPAQFFIILFLSRAALLIFVSTRELGGECFVEGIFSCALGLAAGFLLTVPIWLPQKGERPLSRPAALVYLVYLIITNGAFLGLFQIFLQDTVNPEFSASLTMVLLLGTAVYGAWRGIECVARCGVCVFAFFVLGAALVYFIVLFRFDSANLRPLFYDGPKQTFKGAYNFLAHTTVFADMAILWPQVKGRKTGGFFSWAAGLLLFTGATLLLIAGCLGPYAGIQNFPLYALSSLTEVRSMQRVDAVFIGVWMMALVIRLSAALYAARVCIDAMGGRKAGLAAVLAGTGMLLFAFLTAELRQVREILLDPTVLLVSLIIVVTILPLIRKKGGRARAKKNL